MFTARYGLSPYITQIRLVLKWMILIHQSDMCNVNIWIIHNISSKCDNTDIAAAAAATSPCALRGLYHAGSQQSTSVSTIPFCALSVMTYSLIAPNKYTQFIHYTHLLYLSHMFRCYIHSHHQWKLSKGHKSCPWSWWRMWVTAKRLGEIVWMYVMNRHGAIGWCN